VTASSAEVVITTKLFRPNLRQRTVARNRLHDVLRHGGVLPLTLVVAPAGWGKSTLVADWLAHDRITAGWVSLDSGDNDPMRFWRYLLVAADQAGSAAGAGALRRLDAAGSDVLRDVLPAFVNGLTTADTPLVLVLDDYHLITSAQVHASVATLLDHSPPQLHLMLITRADPPLPLSRLRVRGELAELRADDLRFSLGEALEFFTDRLGPQLSEHDVVRLLARTEGWAAGLQLAALRLRDRSDPSGPSTFIDRFTGADWHIVSYLGEEVLASLEPRLRDFLLVTSVLNRMCAPLCDALTGRDDGAELIGEVHRANLFLMPLDDERRWFRYHQLFGGLLRHELARTGADRPPGLHRRAALWYAEHGDAAEAIGHAIASGDAALSARLVAGHWRHPFNIGQLETVRMWLDALPAEVTAASASLSAARVWVALDTGRLEEVGTALDVAEASLPPDTQLMVLRALHMFKIGDVGGAAAQLREISLSADDPFIATVHRLVQGISAMWLGDTARARELLVEAIHRAEDDGNRLAYIYAEGCRALLAVHRDDLALAESLVLDAESAVGQTLSGSHFVAMFPALARARLGIKRADWEGARRAAAAAVELGRRGAGRVELAAALLTAAAAARDDPDADPAPLITEARGILRHCADPGPLVTSWLAAEERAAAARGRQDGLIEPLTDRELAILRMLPAPSSLRELAAALYVTPNTLKTHLRAIYRKLGAESREEAVIRAHERGLLLPVGPHARELQPASRFPGETWDHAGNDQPADQPAQDQVRKVLVRCRRDRPDIVVQDEARDEHAGRRQHDLVRRAPDEVPGGGHVGDHVHDQQRQGPDGGQVEEGVERRNAGQPERREQREADAHLRRQRRPRHAGRRGHAAQAVRGQPGQPVPAEREHHPGGHSHPAKPGAECAQRRAEIKQVSQGRAHVPLGKLAQRCLSVLEGRHACGAGAETKRLGDDARHVEDGAEGDGGDDRPRDHPRRHQGFLSKRPRRLKACERQEPRNRGQRQDGNAHAGRWHEHRAGRAQAARRVTGLQAPEDRAHEHQNEADGDHLERQQRAGGRLDPAGRQEPGDRPRGERQRVPVGVVSHPRGFEQRPPEYGHADDRYRREQQVGAQQRPPCQESRPWAERTADEGVDRPGVAELSRQPDEPVSDEPDPHGSDREGQRGGPAQQACRGHPGDRHREGGGHDADRDRRRSDEAQLATQFRPRFRPGRILLSHAVLSGHRLAPSAAALTRRASRRRRPALTR
jgi:LuxR family maltose regulon positive regulatory protein